MSRRTARKPMRNPNGFGTVYELPGRRRRPWVALATTGWTTTVAKTGKRAGQEVQKQNRQVVGYFRTKQDALDALVMHRISPVSPKQNMILKELYNEWSAGKYKQLYKSTENNYRAAWKYLQPLERAKVRDIRTGHWQAILDGVKERGLSQSTAQKVRTLMVQLSDHAMTNDIINKNYAKLVDMPRFEKKKKDRFTDLEVKKIADAAAAGVLWADTVLIMIYTGMRISEMLRLTRFEVDLEHQLITGGIKTDAGRDRVVPIHPKIAPYIKKWYDRGGNRLICRDDGSGISADYYRKNYYYGALEAAGVRRLVPHTCRHTFGSMMAEAGVETLYIQQLIGHTDYAFTANEYTHPAIEALKEAINKL